MRKNLLIFLVGAPLLAILLSGVRLYYMTKVWTYGGPEITFEVRPGETFPSINARLGKQSLISSTRVFHKYVQLKDSMTKFKRGTFLIKTESNMFDIYNTLIFGKSIGVKVTIPEGKNLFQIGKLLENKKVVNYAAFVTAAKDPQFVRSLGITADRMEGYLYPDTYLFTKGTSAREIIKNMYAQFKRQVGKLGIESNGYNLHSIVTLASIVEKETGAGHERPMIAGVFLNRLKKKMRLQSDPTTIYGIYEDFNGNLRKKHLREKTPYNTYKIPGLPKGPISNPGLKSLQAVLNPAKHKFIYFVSQNDGTHIFSESYRQHRRAVNKYQKNHRNRKGKSWRDLKKKKTN